MQSGAAAELESELERIIRKNEEIKRKAQENEIFLKNYLDRFSIEDPNDNEFEDETPTHLQQPNHHNVDHIGDYLDNFDMTKLREKYGLRSQKNEADLGVMKHLDELELELTKKQQLDKLSAASHDSRSLHDQPNRHQSKLLQPNNQGSLHLSMSNTEKQVFKSAHQLDPFTDFRLSSDEPIYEAQSVKQSVERSALFKELQRDISNERKKNRRLQILKDQYHEGDEDYELAQARAKYRERNSTSPNPFEPSDNKKSKQTLKSAWEENKLDYFNIQNHGELVNIPSAEVFFLSNKSSTKTINDKQKPTPNQTNPSAAAQATRGSRWTNTLLTYSQDDEEQAEEQSVRPSRQTENDRLPREGADEHRASPNSKHNDDGGGEQAVEDTAQRVLKVQRLQQLRTCRDRLERELFGSRQG